MEYCSPSSQMNYKLLFEDSITKACSLYSVWKVLAAISEIVTLYFWMNDQNLFWFKKIPNQDKFWLVLINVIFQQISLSPS